MIKKRINLGLGFSQDEYAAGLNRNISAIKHVDANSGLEILVWLFPRYLLNKRDKGEANSGLDSSIPFPPEFTPEREFQHVDAQEVQGMKNSLSKRRSEGLSSRVLEDAQPLNEHASPSIDSKKKQVARYWRSSRWFQMNCLSLNVQGLGSKAKKDWIKELNNKHKVNFLSVQETKLDCISDMDVKVLWGNYKFEYTISEAVGNSGGILCVWDPSVFRKEHHVVSDNFVALYGSWVSNQAKLLVVSIYAPQSITSKRSLWSYISSLISRWDGHCMVMGDFNEVRCMEDRLGSVYNAQGANEFNSFISNSGLVEIQLEGYSFTWSLQSAKKMSKLDRFFVSDGLLSLFPHLSGICLDRHLSDHRPILLREVVTDYGPSPFRVYHSWFSLQGFDQMVLETWNNIDLDDNNKMVRFKKKLQILKKEIRSWVNDCKKNQSGRLVDLRSKLCHIDKVIDQGGVNDDILLTRKIVGCTDKCKVCTAGLKDGTAIQCRWKDSTAIKPLEKIPPRNMVAYMEKTNGNTDFHEIIDFLTRSSIHYALTVSPVVSTTFVEEFWMSAKYKIINNFRYITVKVAGKPVNISEASIRSDLLFVDADEIDSLNNQAIFDAIQLMGYEGDLTVLTFNKALFSPQWRFLFHTMNHCISFKSTSWDQIPTNIATAVICLATNQKYNFSKLIFDGMMRHLDAKKKFVMYPRFISLFLTNQLKNVLVPLDHFPINALTPKVFSFMVKKGKKNSWNVTPLFPSMLAQPIEDEGAVLERPSETQPTPSPPHPKGSGRNHRGQSSSDRSISGNKDGLTLQSVYDLYISLCTQVIDQAKEIKHLKAQIKKLKKKAKPVITHYKAWMKSASMKQRLAGNRSLKTKWMQKESVSKQGRKPTKAEPTVHKDPAFDDLDDIVDDAMDYMETEDAQDEERTSSMVLEEKESTQKGVSTEVEVSTVKPDEGTDKSKVSTDKPEVSTAKPKEVEVSTDKLDEGTAKPKDGTSDESTAPTTIFRDDETIAEFLVSMSQTKAKQKGVEIKDAEDSDRPRATSTRSVLTLKPLPKIDPKDKGKKVLEEEAESEGVDEAERKFDQLAKDEEIARKVQEDWEAEEEMKKLLAARLQEEERETFTVEERAKFLYDTIAAQRREEDTIKVPAEQEVTEQGTKKRKSGHVKMISRKRPRPQPDDDSDDKHRKCLRIVTFDSTLDSEIMETKSFIYKLHKVSSPDGNYLVVYRVNGHFRAFNYLLEVLHIFDRQDLFHLYDSVMNQYLEITSEGIKLILWGDLKIMMESSTEENDQELKDLTVIYMLVKEGTPHSPKKLVAKNALIFVDWRMKMKVLLHNISRDSLRQHLNEA
ncbi:RNA-directed DNA polymerase, eukaryota [Tanacetum coccineum]